MYVICTLFYALQQVIRGDDERADLLKIAEELAETTHPEKKDTKKGTQTGKDIQPKTTEKSGASKQTQSEKTKNK